MMTDWNPWSPQAVLLTFDENGTPVEAPDTDAPTDLTPEEWLKLRPRRHRDWGPLLEPTILAPAVLFNPESEIDGPRRGTGVQPPQPSPVLASRLLRMSAGCKEHATEERFQAALAATRPALKHRSILFAWLLETNIVELYLALSEGAFTMRTLAQGLHTQELYGHPRIKMINSQAERHYRHRF